MFVKLHHKDGEAFYVNADMIAEIHHGTINVLGCQTYFNVTETPEEILQMLRAVVCEDGYRKTYKRKEGEKQ